MSNGGRVTTREFYDALLDQNKARADMETRILDRLDDITSFQSAADEKFKAINDKVDTGCVRMDKRIDKNGERLDDHDTEFKEVRKAQKWLGLGEGAMFVLLGWLGLGK